MLSADSARLNPTDVYLLNFTYRDRQYNVCTPTFRLALPAIVLQARQKCNQKIQVDLEPLGN